MLLGSGEEEALLVRLCCWDSKPCSSAPRDPEPTARPALQRGPCLPAPAGVGAAASGLWFNAHGWLG